MWHAAVLRLIKRRTAEVGDTDVLVGHTVKGIDLGPKERHQDDVTIQGQREAEQRRLVVGKEGSVVGWQEGDPDKQGGGHAEENVPRLVVVVGESAGDEAQDCADEGEEKVIRQGDDHTQLGLLTVFLHVPLCEDRHRQHHVRGPDDGCYRQERHLKQHPSPCHNKRQTGGGGG